MTHGISQSLERMGCRTMIVQLPTLREASEELLAAAREEAPKLAMFSDLDLIIVSGPEHIGPWIDAVYGKREWEGLAVPKAAWFHESCRREDMTIDLEPLKWMASDWFFPAIQDAEWHDQEMFVKEHSFYLPFAVDEAIFNEEGRGPFVFDVAFMGMVYPKRRAFLQALQRHHIPPIRVASVNITDLHGYQAWESAMRYARGLREIKVFFNLPSMSRLLVGKVFEVMACGTFLYTPMLPLEGGIGRNMELFNSGEHLVYYRAGHLGGIAQALKEWVSEKVEERQRIAAAGCKLVREKHTLAIRLREMMLRMNLSAQIEQVIQ